MKTLHGFIIWMLMKPYFFSVLPGFRLRDGSKPSKEPEPEPRPTSGRPTATTSETEHERSIRRKWEERRSYIGKENPEWESATRKLVKSRAKKL